MPFRPPPHNSRLMAHDSHLQPSASRLTTHEILRQYWGFESFRPLQEDIIQSVLEGNDTLALMPTGGGKSLCYQVPAMASEGLCLVISPLIALMKDQVENLRRKNITAYAIYSGMSFKEVTNTLKVVSESNCKFLYVSPERLETALFKEYLPGMGVQLIAVDEAHCISQWGYDFRPPYLRLAALREELPGVPVLALTASATKDVQDDICVRLSRPQKGDWKIFRQSFERVNLSYSVFKVDSRINKIISVLNKVPGTAIVYCKSRKRTREISDLLRLQNISSDYYHAGLSQEDRNRKQEDWINNKTRVIVCTNAFGMGIDKPDVRTVIHADVPDCLENYYQEAGRAGRDGKRSYAVLLYDHQELDELKELAELRYPLLTTIRDVYQAIANYLQMPVGGGMGETYDFELSVFTTRFKLDAYTTLYALKALEQDGWLSFNEQVFKPGTVQFKTTKERLYHFEKENPSLDLLLKTLLRAYEGIFDQPVFISEIQVAQLMKTEADRIRQMLVDAHRAGVIEYIPRKDKPQLQLLRPRVKVGDLQINMELYKARKEKFESRANQMISFVKENAECRSRMIGVYFGDMEIRDCGICDNCLSRKNNNLTNEEFQNIAKSILDQLSIHSLPAKELTKQWTGVKRENAWKVIEFLQSENKIIVDGKGLTSLKNTSKNDAGHFTPDS